MKLFSIICKYHGIGDFIGVFLAVAEQASDVMTLLCKRSEDIHKKFEHEDLGFECSVKPIQGSEGQVFGTDMYSNGISSEEYPLLVDLAFFVGAQVIDETSKFEYGITELGQVITRRDSSHDGEA